MNDLKMTIGEFVAAQRSNTHSDLAAKLAYALREAIRHYEGPYENAFSADASFADGEFAAQCSFAENSSMTILYYENTDNETVDDLFHLRDDAELCRLAGLMLSEGWVEGYAE